MAFKKQIVVVLWVMTTLTAHAELRDPTKPNYPSASAAKETSSAQLTAEPVLSAIWISAKSRRATVNGISAHPGQTISGDIKILKIAKNTVIVEQNGTQKTLHLLQRPYQTR